MNGLIIFLATLGGMIFGILLKYHLDSKYFDEIYYIWDEDVKARERDFKAKERRMLSEISRLHRELAPEPTGEPERASESWYIISNDTDNSINDIDFGGF